MTAEELEELLAGKGGMEGFLSLRDAAPSLARRVLAAEKLVEAALARDGGAHDPDCKIGNVWSDNRVCNCGHDEFHAALTAYREASK